MTPVSIAEEFRFVRSGWFQYPIPSIPLKALIFLLPELRPDVFLQIFSVHDWRFIHFGSYSFFVMLICRRQLFTLLNEYPLASIFFIHLAELRSCLNIIRLRKLVFKIQKILGYFNSIEQVGFFFLHFGVLEGSFIVPVLFNDA